MREDEQYKKLCAMSNEQLKKLANKYHVDFNWDRWFAPRYAIIQTLNDLSIDPADLEVQS